MLKPNPSGGTAKKIMSSLAKNVLRQLRKRKSNKPLNPKPIGFRPLLLLVLEIDEREELAGIQLHLTFYQIRTDTDLLFLSTIRLKKTRSKTQIVSAVLFVYLKTTMEKTGYDVRNVSEGRTHFVLLWRNTLFVGLGRDKHFCP
jgi:hypothetical protein